MSANLRRYVSAITLAFALSGRAEAQSVSTESMAVAPNAKESKILRFDGSYNKRDFSAFGFLDFQGRNLDNYYGEIYLRQNIGRNTGLQFEINGGAGFGPVYRAGYIANMPMPKGAYMNVKILPLSIMNHQILGQYQVGLFGHADLPKGFYLEDWTDYTIEKDAKPSVLTEFTGGKNITKKLALQGQTAYNVGSSG